MEENLSLLAIAISFQKCYIDVTVGRPVCGGGLFPMQRPPKNRPTKPTFPGKCLISAPDFLRNAEDMGIVYKNPSCKSFVKYTVLPL